MVVAEVGAFALTLRLLDRHRPAFSRPLTMLWLVSPVSLLHVALGGQDEALILLTWTVVASLVMRGWAVAAGATVVIGYACTKLLGVFAGLPLVGQPSRQVWRAAVAAVVALGTFAGFLVVLALPLGDLARESRLVTSGNVWALITIARGGRGPEPMVATLVLTAAVLAAAGVIMHRRPWPGPIDQLLRVSGTMACLFLLFSQKSFANYLVIFLPGLLYLALEAPVVERAFLLGLVLPVSAFEPSLWFHLREGAALSDSMAGRLAILAADLTLVVGYVLVARRGLCARSAPLTTWQAEAA
jgi:hypothetical protein